jgi:RNA polymerase sigma-70 factor (ECF subfamily)
MNAIPPRPLDEELVIRAGKGDREAFGLLYDRFARLARCVAYDAAQNWEAANDITQETFLRAYRRIGTLREPAKFCSWLIGIEKMVILEQRRKPSMERLGTREPSADDDAARSVEERDELERIMQLVAQLPEQEGLAIHAYFLNGQNADSTADLLRYSRSGIYALLNRACAKLADWLGVHDPESKGKS